MCEQILYRWCLAIKPRPSDRDRSNFFVVITGCNGNDNMMLLVKLVVVFVVNFAMNKMI